MFHSCSECLQQHQHPGYGLDGNVPSNGLCIMGLGPSWQHYFGMFWDLQEVQVILDVPFGISCTRFAPSLSSPSPLIFCHNEMKKIWSPWCCPKQPWTELSPTVNYHKFFLHQVFAAVVGKADWLIDHAHPGSLMNAVFLPWPFILLCLSSPSLSCLLPSLAPMLKYSHPNPDHKVCLEETHTKSPGK